MQFSRGKIEEFVRQQPQAQGASEAQITHQIDSIISYQMNLQAQRSQDHQQQQQQREWGAVGGGVTQHTQLTQQPWPAAQGQQAWAPADGSAMPWPPQGQASSLAGMMPHLGPALTPHPLGSEARLQNFPPLAGPGATGAGMMSPLLQPSPKGEQAEGGEVEI